MSQGKWTPTTDATIPELGGARHDATALRPLSTDTVEGLAGRLLVGETAKHAGVSQVIVGRLSAAFQERHRHGDTAFAYRKPPDVAE